MVGRLQMTLLSSNPSPFMMRPFKILLYTSASACLCSTSYEAPSVWGVYPGKHSSRPMKELEFN